MWEDSLIDKEAKKYLKWKENGRKLPLDIVAHLEFFYNTLLMSHESVNPFKRPQTFEALLYPVFQPKLGGEYGEMQLVSQTLLDIHRQLVYPRSSDKGNGSLFDGPSSDNEEDTQSLLSLASLDIRKYSWYPNKKLEAAISTYTVSPTPKRFD